VIEPARGADWQFVVWARQFALFLTYAVPNLVLDLSRVQDETVQVCSLQGDTLAGRAHS
jgi:hypothetical protein